MGKQLQNWKTAIEQAKPRFEKILAESKDTPLIWAKEAGYAEQIIKRNDRLQACPLDSIRDAIINVAAIGLTLHPDQKLAYLVPRDGQAQLNISYIGLARLAQESGAIEFVRANVVHENDHFAFRGLDEKPEHHYNPFAKIEERGGIVGVYCYVKTSTGHFLTDVMSHDEIETVRKTSKAPNSPAWTKWYGEMAKKAVIKRAAKLWPRLAQDRLAPALKVVNEAEGLADDQLSGTHTAEFATPQRKSEPTPADEDKPVIDGEFEEVEVEEIEAAPPPPDFVCTRASRDRAPLAEGARRVISSKLAAASLPEDRLFRAFEVSDWDELAQADANSILEWISSEAAG